MSEITIESIQQRHTSLLDRIASCGVAPDSVTVLAVTKTVDPEVAALAVSAGLTDLGENYAQELVAKAPVVAGANWHFIGGLQRNKVRKIADLVSCWQSVDRGDLATEIAKRAPGARILIQVNTTGESQKSGCEPSELDALVDLATNAGLEVAGLMTVGPTTNRDPRPAFAQLRGHVDRLGLEVASMGMSGDLEAAVREGSTMIRVGTALFGPRPTTA